MFLSKYEVYLFITLINYLKYILKNILSEILIIIRIFIYKFFINNLLCKTLNILSTFQEIYML